MGSPERRLARNEALFREVNESVRSLPANGNEGPALHDFFCECPDLTCTIRVKLTGHEYETARTDGTRFIVVPGHQREQIERVVFSCDRYLIVEKEDEAADEAEERDPRD